jgi:hypothetical protein
MYFLQECSILSCGTRIRIQIHSVLFVNAGSGSGSALNQCGSATCPCPGPGLIRIRIRRTDSEYALFLPASSLNSHVSMYRRRTIQIKIRNIVR